MRCKCCGRELSFWDKYVVDNGARFCLICYDVCKPHGKCISHHFMRTAKYITPGNKYVVIKEVRPGLKIRWEGEPLFEDEKDRVKTADKKEHRYQTKEPDNFRTYWIIDVVGSVIDSLNMRYYDYHMMLRERDRVAALNPNLEVRVLQCIQSSSPVKLPKREWRTLG